MVTKVFKFFVNGYLGVEIFAPFDSVEPAVFGSLG
jgi:hypothetical protein